MQFIPQKQGSDPLALTGLILQMKQQAEMKRMNSLKKAETFRSLGFSDRAAEELNKAEGKGFMSKWFGDTDLGGFLFGKYNTPQDFLVGGLGPKPKELSKDEGKQAAIAAAMNEMQQNQGGFGTGLEAEMKSGWGKKAAALANERVNLQAAPGEKIAGVGYGDVNKSIKTEYSQEQLDTALQRHTDVKAYDEAKAGLDPKAESQYQRSLNRYVQARESGNVRNARLMYEQLVKDWGALDNRFGWDMSQKLGRIAGPPSGGRPGAGSSKDYYINERTGKKRLNAPLDSTGNLQPGWRKMTASVEQGYIENLQKIITNKDGTYSQDEVENAEARLQVHYKGAEGVMKDAQAGYDKSRDALVQKLNDRNTPELVKRAIRKQLGIDKEIDPNRSVADKKNQTQYKGLVF